MKALILAAGLGTRLKPFTNTLPKPLFPVAGRGILDRIITKLSQQGVSDIIINTHHLHWKIDDYLNAQNYAVSVQTRFEPQILGTGGALKNISDFWQEGPLLIFNGDILTDIDLAWAYQYHSNHNCPVTMVMHDYPVFNGVLVSCDGFIKEFGVVGAPVNSSCETRLAYTGIQIVERSVLEMIPGDGFYDIIDIYKKFISCGGKIAACISEKHTWHDMGSLAGLRNAALSELMPEAFACLNIDPSDIFFEEIHLTGDGSDRKWSRLRKSSATAILADHGITGFTQSSEVNSFICIGRHLAQKKIAVPQILATDAFSGLVILEDLGDDNLQSKVLIADNDGDQEALYRKVIDQLILFSIEGAKDFDLKWTYQTENYSKEMILEKECRYFIEAFVNGYLGLSVRYQELYEEFELLAEMTCQNGLKGLMHRDCQSRNIMWYKDQCYFIDFQGARMGPIQYDLASLLIDPYVNLTESLQSKLLTYYEFKLADRMPQWSGKWQQGYACCQLTRNLQILGAFAFLSNVKGKTSFARYIPTALETLRKNLNTSFFRPFKKLTELINKIPSST